MARQFLIRVGVVVASLMLIWSAGLAAQLPRSACIQLPAQSTNATTGSRGTGSVAYSCAFDRSAVTLTCTGGRGGISVTTITTWKSVDDVVDTISAIPPRVLSASLKLNGPGATSTAYTYDGQKRLTREVATTPAAGITVTMTRDYSNWDTAGRPRKAHLTVTPGNRPASDEAIAYDDAKRTKTITTTQNGAVVSTDVITFDTNGNQVSATGTEGKNSYTSKWTISSTTQVCR